MVRFILLLALMISGCGNDKETIREVIPEFQKTKTECWFETRCTKVQSVNKWGQSCLKKVCKQVEICEESEVPAGI